jgi:predicted metal-dependent hydrolase
MNAPLVSINDAEISFKPIKHLYLRIERDTGRIKISAPRGTKMRTIERFLSEKSSWILQKQQTADKRKIRNQQAPNGIKLWGETLDLKIERSHRRSITRDQTHCLRVVLLHSDGEAEQQRLLDHYYRLELKEKIAHLSSSWERHLGVSANEYRVKKMRTRWGSCNIRSKRIWLNLWLAEKPIEQFELVLVHELVHLIEAGHGKRFQDLMNRWLPDWRDRDKALNLK